jgi:hypothetical protein
MAGALSAAFGRVATEPVVTGEFRPGDVRHVFASVDRAQELLGFRAEVAFGESMLEFAHVDLREPAARPVRIRETDRQRQGTHKAGADIVGLTKEAPG